MAKFTRYNPLIVALACGIALQLGFICADKHDAPNGAAVEFSKAYFKLDKCTMDQYVCESLKKAHAIDGYIYSVSSQARARGFQASYVKSSLSHIRTDVVERNDSHAVVRLIAQKRQSINPVFELVGVLFGFIDTEEVTQNIPLVRENNEWKVCGDILHLS